MYGNRELKAKKRVWKGHVELLFFGKFYLPSLNINSETLPNSPNACGLKPYPKRKSCGFKNIGIRVDGASISISNLTRLSIFSFEAKRKKQND